MPALAREMYVSEILDVTRRYLSDGLTPSRLGALWKQVDYGDYAAAWELSEEMEGKDAHLQDVASRRREAVTALDWSIEADARANDQDAAKATADFCQRTLDNLSTFAETLEHLALAVGPGVSVAELVWHHGALVETVDVPGTRLNDGPDGKGVWLTTDDDPLYGIKTETPKFIVHKPNSRAGFPLRVTLTRAAATLFVLKHFNLAAWSSFVDVYGMPLRIARITGTPMAGEHVKVEEMLQKMATDTYGIFSDKVDVQFLEAARQSQPYEGFVEWIESKMTVLYLGQTLTTTQGSVGSLALGKVHENVRASITRSDIQHEARTIRRQLLEPMCRFQWPNQSVPVPHFWRRVAEDKDLDEQRLALEKLRFAREIGLPIDEAQYYDLLKLPVPSEGTGARVET